MLSTWDLELRGMEEPIDIEEASLFVEFGDLVFGVENSVR